MIAYLKGEIAEITEENAVIEVGEIGYNVKISAATAQLLPGIGEKIKLHTYTYVREDAFQLFGFLTKDDLEMFRKVITVSGIGPKGGLAILSVMDSDTLKLAILAGDVKAISKAPGVGAKTAERLVLELRDKVFFDHDRNASEQNGSLQNQYGVAGDAGKEAVEALVSLGYSASEALKAVRQAEVMEQAGTEEILKAALKKIGRLG